MEKDQTLEHETTLEHAFDVAKANQKEALRLLEGARTGNAAGDVSDERVRQLEDLLAIAEEDLRRVAREL